MHTTNIVLNLLPCDVKGVLVNFKKAITPHLILQENKFSAKSSSPSRGEDRNPNGNRRVAFTLAEVLITLGIIGIVSAMIIPTLINNYKEKVRDNQFKKVYATIMQAYNASVAEYGYYPKCYYLPDGPDVYVSGCTELYEKMKNKLRIAKSCTNNSYDKGCLLMYEGVDKILQEQHKNDENYDPEEWSQFASRNYYYYTTNGIANAAPSWVLNDGTIIIFSGYHPAFLVDINGNQGPNKIGYDVFSLRIAQQPNKAIRIAGLPVGFSKGGVSVSNLMQKLFGYY